MIALLLIAVAVLEILEEIVRKIARKPRRSWDEEEEWP